MRRDQLEHAIRAACDVSGDTELLVFGSQAILGSHPLALGELSLFHQTHGFYVHGVSIKAAILPAGWDQRTVAVCDPEGTRGNTGHCLEAHDLAASKLVADREKDRVFVVTLLLEGLIAGEILLERVADLPVERDRRDSISRWVRATLEDVG